MQASNNQAIKLIPSQQKYLQVVQDSNPLQWNAEELQQALNQRMPSKFNDVIIKTELTGYDLINIELSTFIECIKEQGLILQSADNVKLKGFYEEIKQLSLYSEQNPQQMEELRIQCSQQLQKPKSNQSSDQNVNANTPNNINGNKLNESLRNLTQILFKRQRQEKKHKINWLRLKDPFLKSIKKEEENVYGLPQDYWNNQDCHQVDINVQDNSETLQFKNAEVGSQQAQQPQNNNKAQNNEEEEEGDDVDDNSEEAVYEIQSQPVHQPKIYSMNSNDKNNVVGDDGSKDDKSDDSSKDDNSSDDDEDDEDDEDDKNNDTIVQIDNNPYGPNIDINKDREEYTYYKNKNQTQQLFLQQFQDYGNKNNTIGNNQQTNIITPNNSNNMNNNNNNNNNNFKIGFNNDIQNDQNKNLLPMNNEYTYCKPKVQWENQVNIQPINQLELQSKQTQQIQIINNCFQNINEQQSRQQQHINYLPSHNFLPTNQINQYRNHNTNNDDETQRYRIQTYEISDQTNQVCPLITQNTQYQYSKQTQVLAIDYTVFEYEISIQQRKESDIQNYFGLKQFTLNPREQDPRNFIINITRSENTAFKNSYLINSQDCSRNHVQICCNDKFQFCLDKNEGRNGTFIKSRRFQRIKTGMQLQVGNIFLEFINVNIIPEQQKVQFTVRAFSITSQDQVKEETISLTLDQVFLISRNNSTFLSSLFSKDGQLSRRHGEIRLVQVTKEKNNKRYFKLKLIFEDFNSRNGSWIKIRNGQQIGYDSIIKVGVQNFIEIKIKAIYNKNWNLNKDINVSRIDPQTQVNYLHPGFNDLDVFANCKIIPNHTHNKKSLLMGLGCGHVFCDEWDKGYVENIILESSNKYLLKLCPICETKRYSCMLQIS